MLNITIKTTGIEATPAIKAYVEDKFRMVEKLLDPTDSTARADVEVGQTTRHHQSGDVFRTEVNFTSKQGKLRISRTEDDLYASIDRAKDELLDELRDSKHKHVSLVRRGQRMFKEMLQRFGNQ